VKALSLAVEIAKLIADERDTLRKSCQILIDEWKLQAAVDEDNNTGRPEETKEFNSRAASAYRKTVRDLTEVLDGTFAAENPEVVEEASMSLRQSPFLSQICQSSHKLGD